MRVMISTFGTHGDVQPFLALGHGLRTAGYEVALCTSASYQTAVEAWGLQYAFMSDTMLTLTRALLAGSTSPLTVMPQLQAAMGAMLHEEWAAARSWEPDLIVYHPKMLGSYHLAEKLGIPAVMAIPLPFYTPTRAFPNPFFAGLKLGGWANQASFRLMGLSSGMYSGLTNRFRAATLGLPPLRRFADLLVAQDGAPIPVLYPYSPHLLPVPADFPAHVHVTGSWFLPHSRTYTPPPELADFLASGAAPVYVGFGSMSGRRAARRAQVVLEALAQTGQRGVLARGWGGLAAADLPGWVTMVDEVPHDWLFPKMTAVVHHGGAGTTAAGLRAGKPTVICPFLGDQPFWGRVIYERGLGPRPIPQWRVTSARLASALDTVVSDPAMQRRAAAVGAAIAAEDGVGQAVTILSRLLGAAPVAPTYEVA